MQKHGGKVDLAEVARATNDEVRVLWALEPSVHSGQDLLRDNDLVLARRAGRARMAA
jgi:hypothetical protein